MNPLPPWAVERRESSAEGLHIDQPPESAVPTVRLMRVTAPALILGSSQQADVVDAAEADSQGVAIVRRRSGGGAVLLLPGHQTWIDFWIPAGHPWFGDDIVASADHFGIHWAAVLRPVVPTNVHSGGLDPGRWGDLICFGGRGPGEVFDSDGRKMVGLSQRRTRNWIRAQTLVHRSWDVDRTVDLLALGAADRAAVKADLADRVATTDQRDVDLLARLASLT